MGTMLCSPWQPGSPKFGGQFGALLIDIGLLPSNGLALFGAFFTVTSGEPEAP